MLLDTARSNTWVLCTGEQHARTHARFAGKQSRSAGSSGLSLPSCQAWGQTVVVLAGGLCRLLFVSESRPFVSSHSTSFILGCVLSPWSPCPPPRNTKDQVRVPLREGTSVQRNPVPPGPAANADGRGTRWRPLQAQRGVRKPLHTGCSLLSHPRCASRPGTWCGGRRGLGHAGRWSRGGGTHAAELWALATPHHRRPWGSCPFPIQDVVCPPGDTGGTSRKLPAWTLSVQGSP